MRRSARRRRRPTAFVRSSSPILASATLTERRPHLAGALGAAICERFFANGWIEPASAGRAVRLTPLGRSALADLSSLQL